MSSYSDFADKLLIAIYQETESTGRPFQKVGEVIRKYSIFYKPLWISQVCEEWEHTYFSKISRVLSSYEAWSVRLSALGVREIERRYGGKDGVGTILEPTEVREQEDPQAMPPWRSLARDFALSLAQRSTLIESLDKVERDIDGVEASNANKAQALSYVNAAKSLVEAPDPDVDLIWEILNRASAISGIASLFVSILALFVG